jgi:LysR family glycine cleavage system transcriptional activator
VSGIHNLEAYVTPRLPPLQTLRAFEAVVRLGSVSRAAEELGRTHGAVSKQLRALREDMGVSLFDRAGTGLQANAAGRQLAAAVAEALGALGARYSEIVRGVRSPEVRVACSASFAMGWLVPHMPAFVQAHPDVRIRLSMTSARAMREDDEADLVVLWDRSGYPLAAQGRAIRLADSRFGLVAAPAYPVERIGDRLKAQCRILHDHTAAAWDRWAAVTAIQVEAAASASFPHTHLCLGAAVAGLGVAIAERRLAAAEIKAGRLIAVTAFAALPEGFAAIPHASRPMSPEAGLFLKWLSEALEAD